MGNGKITLRRSETNHPAAPYEVVAEGIDRTLRGEIGDVYILEHQKASGEEIYAWGISPEGVVAVSSLIGFTQNHGSLTSEVYNSSVKYAVNLARTIPEDTEFVNEVETPVEIDFEQYELGG